MYDGLLLDHDGVITTLVDGGSLRGAARTALRDAGVQDPDESAVRALAIHVDNADLLEVSRQYDLDPDRLWRYRDERAYETLRDAVDAEIVHRRLQVGRPGLLTLDALALGGAGANCLEQPHQLV